MISKNYKRGLTPYEITYFVNLQKEKQILFASEIDEIKRHIIARYQPLRVEFINITRLHRCNSCGNLFRAMELFYHHCPEHEKKGFKVKFDNQDEPVI